jgi:hypothetical protein
MSTHGEKSPAGLRQRKGVSEKSNAKTKQPVVEKNKRTGASVAVYLLIPLILAVCVYLYTLVVPLSEHQADQPLRSTDTEGMYAIENVVPCFAIMHLAVLFVHSNVANGTDVRHVIKLLSLLQPQGYARQGSNTTMSKPRKRRLWKHSWQEMTESMCGFLIAHYKRAIASTKST